MLLRSCNPYSQRLQVCVESVTRPEREEDLLVLIFSSSLRFTAPVGLVAPPAEAACRVGDDVSRGAWAYMHATTRVLTCPGGEDVLDRVREDPDDETPWPRGGPRCSARALLGRASQS